MVQEKDRAWLKETIEKVKRKMKAVSERSAGKIPYTSVNGVHDDRSGADRSFSVDLGIYWWTNGFWGGMMWMLYHETGEQRFADIAVFSEEKMDYCLQDFYGLHHDVGFMYLPTAV
ncbi:MAG: glycosyl hydrolase family 88, partial [Lachnospiraceae bacterium]|nr:glycosyl hydrolase family 88 [Lachnospiraceae bacterium]